VSPTYPHVYNLLDKNKWNNSNCSEQKYEAYGFKTNKKLRSLPCWIFGSINHARNDFLHGNPITPSRLIVSPSKRPLNLYTAPLYRMALSALVDLKHEIKKPRATEKTEYEAYLEDQFLFGKYQMDIEAALSTIMHTEEEYSALRTRPRRSQPPTHNQSPPYASSAAPTPPIIPLMGNNPATIHVGDTYNDLGATITGPANDLNLGIKTYLNGILVSNIVLDTTSAATDTIDYVATDQSGLTSTSTRTVIIDPLIPPPATSNTNTTTSAFTTRQ
jgi:hypothetical protein